MARQLRLDLAQQRTHLLLRMGRHLRADLGMGGQVGVAQHPRRVEVVHQRGLQCGGHPHQPFHGLATGRRA
jgi:hypothetical protein